MQTASAGHHYTQNSLVLVVLATLCPHRTGGLSITGPGWSLQHQRAAD